MISIIIPVYNVEEYLEKCLNSCFEQTIRDIEIIVVNDGSTDYSGEIADKLALKESRLTVLHQANKGVAAARNLGVENARNKWILFVDSDDYLEKDAAEILLTAANETNAQIIIANFVSVNPEGTIMSRNFIPEVLPTNNKEIAELLLQEKLPFSLCGKLFHRSLFNETKINTELKLGEDAYLTIQLCNNANEIVSLNNVIYNYLQRASSATHQPNESSIRSILNFIELTINYYKTKDYYLNTQFQHSLNIFIMREYFTYIRLGGKYSNSQIQTIVNSTCLHDTIACNLTPKWRILLLKSYRFNCMIGNCVRLAINFTRKIRTLCNSK